MKNDKDLPDRSQLDDARLRQQAIGAGLRRMFDEVVNEPVPDEFLELLRRADQRPADSEVSAGPLRGRE